MLQKKTILLVLLFKEYFFFSFIYFFKSKNHFFLSKYSFKTKEKKKKCWLHKKNILLVLIFKEYSTRALKSTPLSDKIYICIGIPDDHIHKRMSTGICSHPSNKQKSFITNKKRQYGSPSFTLLAVIFDRWPCEGQRGLVMHQLVATATHKTDLVVDLWLSGLECCTQMCVFW